MRFSDIRERYFAVANEENERDAVTASTSDKEKGFVPSHRHVPTHFNL